jgi:suppressor of G2 allele of SKP1
MDRKTPETEVKAILRNCDELFRQKKFEESLALASSPQAQNSVVELLPYVLEMQVRNQIALLQFSTALKLITETLKYLPNLRDFLFRKVECELALGKTDEARKGLADLQSKMEQDDEKDLVWRTKVQSLQDKLDLKCNRELNQVRVYFKEETGERVRLEEHLKKVRELYTFEQDDMHVTVRPKSKAVKSKEPASLSLFPSQFKLSFTTVEDKVFSLDLDLFAEIVPELSVQYLENDHVVLRLYKKEQGKIWDFLEEQLSVENQGANKAHLTHTQKRWNQICTDFEEDLERNKLGDGDPAMNLFKQIYANANEDTRRAMMKSYMESGGTVL